MLSLEDSGHTKEGLRFITDFRYMICMCVHIHVCVIYIYICIYLKSYIDR